MFQLARSTLRTPGCLWKTSSEKLEAALRCVALRVLTFVAVSCALAQLPVTSLLAVHWAGLARRPCMALCMEVSRAERSQPWEAGVQQRSVSPSLT